MNITRNTMRADGLTVGQVMDRDAAFLRSIGIPAKDGVKPYPEQCEDFKDKFRDAVLAAMDAQSDDGKTWCDSDLPALFAAIDPIAKRLFWNTTLAIRPRNKP